jgi:hypothetical protein
LLVSPFDIHKTLVSEPLIFVSYLSELYPYSVVTFGP